ncbi:hypothetical protein MMC07_005340 [Pseudocyphellaria aurata]|nr:hypothetical protein [Pseudocyphellaria aurata]
MPPFIPRKHRHSSPLIDVPASNPARKENLFETVDNAKSSSTLKDNRNFLEDLNVADTESSLSDVSTSGLEELHILKRRKVSRDNEEKEEEGEPDWEDAIHLDTPHPNNNSSEPTETLELTLEKGARPGASLNLHTKRKGPSKIERKIRVSTHCMHVQFLLFHNLIRNGWTHDKEVQRILVNQLPPGVQREIEKWRIDSGLGVQTSPENLSLPLQTRCTKRRPGAASEDKRSQSDWGAPAERLERGIPNFSRGDPLIRLLKVLAAYWKKRFIITAPQLRKQGYKPLAQLETEIASLKNDPHDPEKHGEILGSIYALKDLAKKCAGSRDVGAQLFTALIRGLGIEARLVASIQPVGFGWGKAEEAAIKRRKDLNETKLEREDTWSHSDGGVEMTTTQPKGPIRAQIKKSKLTKDLTAGQSRSREGRDAPIDLPEYDGNSNCDPSVSADDDVSVVDITPSTLRDKPAISYDREILFPTYWTEVISPITNEVYPVDSFILNPAVATSQEHLSLFESRGAKADKAKQVFAYAIAFSSDGTAKDVTTRYLKRHMWPGRTKGVRRPAEKVPVYDRKGRIKHYEEYDWFKSVMSGYMRTSHMRTAVDDLEEAKDLKPLTQEKKELTERPETLQGYKNSADFILERHLRREEAVLPGSKPVKTFLTGKGDKAKEEPVYMRKDVAICRTSESWHKEGRQVKAGEQSIKLVPVRAVTLTRKREVEEAERDGGARLKQGLYAWDQTDWIIPPPIENGVIPKNAFGNMDCYVPTMVPKGAVHIPLRSTAKICKRLGIDYAEACTGFEFGNQRAVPVITGVVVAAEHEDLVINEWEKDEQERKVKQEGKREKVALAAWRKMLMGLRIMRRVREEYGGNADEELKEEINPFTNRKKRIRPDPEREMPDIVGHIDEVSGDDMAGGFLVEDLDEVKDSAGRHAYHLDENSTFVRDEYPLGSEELAVMKTASPAPSISKVVNIKPSNTTPGENEIDSGTARKTAGKRQRGIGQNSESNQSNKDPVPVRPLQRSTLRKRLETSTLETAGTTLNAEPAMSTHTVVTREKNIRRAVPKRTAARRSEDAIKSHYFAHDSEDNAEILEILVGGEETVHEPPPKPRQGCPKRGWKSKS